jgi:Amt family ammonium transporter
VLGAASGAVAGLVAITPASGFVGPLASVIIGLSAGLICYMAVSLKGRLGYDDSLDAVGVHGVGGILGAVATGLFATKAVNPAGADGLFFGNPSLLFYQLISVGAAVIYSFGMTYLLLKVLDLLMGLRVKEEDEVIGLDLSQHGERGYTMTIDGEL